MAEPRTRADSVPFYVNYLPLHPVLRRSMLAFLGSSLGLAICVASVWSMNRADPGSATWDDGRSQTFSGVLIPGAYPMLLTTDPQTGLDRTMLLVEVGKRGVQSRFNETAPRHIELSGWLLTRDDRTMLELEPEQSVRSSTQPPPPIDIDRVSERPGSPGIVQLRGEIVDSKCYLGAMKPGSGKAHKACATLCVRGGVAPVLVVSSPGSGPRAYLIRGADSGALPSLVEHLIADPVEIQGQHTILGDLHILTVSAENVRRL
ncbi:MAG: hypothetical protein K2X32_05005 [Phycisphaerales bacterium]|nr:hypothetical protein [Phycisphaerales bacterium]